MINADGEACHAVEFEVGVAAATPYRAKGSRRLLAASGSYWQINIKAEFGKRKAETSGRLWKASCSPRLNAKC